MQHLFKRHDFAAIQKSLQHYTVIFVLCSQLSVLVIQMPALNLQLFGNTPLANHSVAVDSENTGGGRVSKFSLEELQPHISSDKGLSPGTGLKYVAHNHRNVVNALYEKSDSHVYGQVPLELFASRLTLANIKTIAKIHGIHVPSRPRVDDLHFLFKGHTCACCETHISVFALHSVKTNSEKCKKWYSGLDASRKKEKQKRENSKNISEQRQKKMNSEMQRGKVTRPSLHSFHLHPLL